jgi:hypothetical protein
MNERLVVGVISAGLVVWVSAGCAGGSADETQAARPSKTTVTAVMARGTSHTTIRGVRIEWRRLPNGRVCYDTTLPRHPHKGGNGSLSACVKHLGAQEIAYVIQPRHTGQLMVAGLKGSAVKSVYLRFSANRKWTPRANRSAFFGYVPEGNVVSIVKVLSNGTTQAFPVGRYSK